MSFNWTFDPRSQTLHAPSGLTITVREIAQMLADRRDCRYDFAGDWSGWKMRGNKLVPPFSGRTGARLTPQNAKRFLAWVNVNRPGFELTPRSWTNFRGFHEEVQNRVQARGRQKLLGR